MGTAPDRVLDTSGLTGDRPLANAKRELEMMAAGQVLEFIVTDPDTSAMIAGWLPGSGATLAGETDIPEMLGIEGRWVYYLRKD